LLAEAVGGLQELLGGQVGTDDLNVHTGPFDTSQRDHPITELSGEYSFVKVLLVQRC
jgi:hypothetical protein